MNILVIGSTGQLGWELQQSVAEIGEVTAVDYPEFDLTQADSIHRWVGMCSPEVIINAAAYTAVDRAEEEPEAANAVNATAPGLLAEMARERKALLIHFSTDYVFDGKKGEPYAENDQPNPINVYGASKLAGERAVQQVGGHYFIFRTSWLYSTRRDCFLTKVLRWVRSPKVLRIVSDQTGSPTWARTLAEATAGALHLMLERGPDWCSDKAGIYHAAGNGAVSRFQWAKKIIALDPQPEEHRFTKLVEARSADFETLAKRPSYSALDCTRFQETFVGFTIPWDAALASALTY